MDPITIQMAPVARRVVEQVLAVQPGENVLIVADSERPPTITQALASREVIKCAVAGCDGVLRVLVPCGSTTLAHAARMNAAARPS